MIKVLVSRNFGGLHFSKGFLVDFPQHKGRVDRTDYNLFADMAQYGYHACQENVGDLAFAEIPEESTDFYVEEHDGYESVLYVENGKIHRAKVVEL